MILSPPAVVTLTQAFGSVLSAGGWRFVQCLCVGLLLSVTPVFAANPDPSNTSTLGMVVHNPATNAAVTVTGFIVDPTGTPTAGTVAFVLTSDGYSFLVKPVGDLIYNSDDPPVAMKIVSKDSAAGTVQIRPNSLAPTDPTTSLGYQTLLTTMEGVLNPPDTPGTLTLPVVTGNATSGVRIVNTGGNGSNGRDGALIVPPNHGGDGAGGPGASYPNAGFASIPFINTTNAIGIEVGSVGGRGGNGGDSYLSIWGGRDGGNGGVGGPASVTVGIGNTVATSGDNMFGIFAYSRGGQAGNGGSGFAAPGAGTGGHSSNGGAVTVLNQGTVTTTGDGAFGIYGLSVSDNGGSGGSTWGLVGVSGSGGYGGSGGAVIITNSVDGTISTTGIQSHGILAQSIGGSGGSAGISGNLLVALSGAGDNGGNGGTVEVENRGTILTSGDSSRGIFAQSIGGGGGSGGIAGGLVSVGGSGSNGGSAAAVTVTNYGTGIIQTQGFDADGIMAQSIGGSGGSGSNAYGLVAVGGSGKNAGNGGVVTVSNLGKISTLEDFARGIVAQSIGGGGGDGGSTGGMVSVGGNAGVSITGGGIGDVVTVTNGGSIITGGADAAAIVAQSIGGGGGNGGSAGSIGLFAGVAVGGKGSSGGKGGDVDILLQGQSNGDASLIKTIGDRSTGLFAQSVGGGGGNGGGAVALSVGFGASASFAIGGGGAVAGDGGIVTLTRGTGLSKIETAGSDSTGVFLQSVGGGGGNGGYAVALAVSGGPASGSLGLALGGNGSGGGIGGAVTVGTFSGGTMTSTGFEGTILTTGDRSTGFLAQSVGGGGGNGGLAVAGAAGFSPTISGGIAIGLGGQGTGGGAGGKVQVGFAGSITTQGDSSTAMLVQSVGGGGGNGGGSIAASLAVGNGAAGVSIGLGGAAGKGSNGGDVNVVTRASSTLVLNPNTIRTEGSNSTAILIQSVGGGGGNGGYAVAAGASGGAVGAGTVTVGLGGSGGGGGNGGSVTADLQSNVETSSVMRAVDPATNLPIPPYAENSSGVVVQSVGGGGGNGGFSVAAGAALAGDGSGAVSVGLGGSGATGGTGGTVNVKSTGSITTKGDRSAGLVAQSIGGGGGNGGYNISVAGAASSVGSGAITVGLGGSGGNGNFAQSVTVNTSLGKISTGGSDSIGILAQSIGGGGGNGGYNVSVSASGAGGGSGAVSVGLGGSGGTGGYAGDVNLTVANAVSTTGKNSAAIVAQSIGGGGGNGGYDVSASGSGGGSGSGAIGVGLGGKGASGGDGANVTALVSGNVDTLLENSAGIMAQSIGGGGGNGGYNISLAGSGGGISGAVGVGLGGSGSGGGDGKTVNLTSEGTILTQGASSTAFLAQSIGGGGGNGGFNVNVALSGGGTTSGAVSVGLGGSGAGGGVGGIVIASTSGNITTQGDKSAGILAQSIGGGGGNGGFDVSVSGSGSGETSGAVSVGLGGSGAGGGNASSVTLTVVNNIITQGRKSTGIIAQSVGGGGGNGGFDVTAAMSGSTSNSGAVGVSLGGSAGSGGNADTVITSITGNVTTSASGSGGILSQSLGGGGGNGGMSIVGALSFASSGSGAVSVGLGGSGGDGGYSGKVTSTVTGNVSTTGADSFGIITQSLGGGGGAGGMSISGAVAMAKTGAGAVGIGLGGVGGGGGDAADVKGTYTGYVQTTGDNSSGIITQSLGGGGGNGGLNITGTITASKEGSGSIAVGLGGFGGDGGDGKNVVSIVTGGVSTTGSSSDGVVAQSFGGGGGNGGLNVTGTVNLSQKSGGTLGVGLGGFGGVGGNAGNVTSTVTMTTANPKVKVTGSKSSGIVAQSLGGGGGNGGIDITGAVNLTGENGAAIGIGIGGFGGGAGNAGIVTVNVSGQVLSSGAGSSGILAQSVGGGGGDGGINVTGTLAITQSKGTSSTAVAASIGVGGFGAGGGTGGAVYVSYDGTILSGVRGIVAQSIGGGGGNGGVNVSTGIAYGSGDGDARGLVIGVGGFGGVGGNADIVNVLVTGAVQITAVEAGILAQSIGGGGGNGGTNVSGSITSNAPITVGVGGMGANAGVAKDVTVDATASFSIYGPGIVSSAGVMAQSLGGGGGNGGVDVTGSLVINKTSSLPSINVGVGGFGGAGAISGDVTVTQVGNIVATGAWTHGIMAQSIAGGGGNGGLNVSGQLDFAAAENAGGNTDLTIVAGVGGNGGLGADAGNVVVTQNGAISTTGDNARGIIAQSIGGGGGTGGMNITGVLAMKSSPIQVGVGGTGGGGGEAGSVIVTRGSATTATGQIATNGQSAHGIEATSIGGGGGDAGMNFNLGLTRAGAGVNPPGFAASFTIGGAGGQAASGDFVTVNNYSSIYTQGLNSHGIIAQSIGGGGGNASFNVGVIYGGSNNSVGENKNLGFALTIGGGTGDGGHGGAVDVVQVGNITTLGNASYGVVAQSIGGGGGNAGLDFGMDIVDGGSASISIGRKGGTGGYASAVSLSSTGTITTYGAGSYGLLAQSVGNGGGNSSATTVGVSGPKTKDDASQGFNVSVGLEGGMGGYAGDVILNAQGAVTTYGDDAHAIFAQSVGGGGGNGGSSNTFGLSAVTVGVSIGGLGGEGGYSGVVSVTSSAQVRTYGSGAVGILAQSIGGGGGNGGMSTSGGLSSDVNGITVGVGGSGGQGMYSGKVFVDNSGVIITNGVGSDGILAQSLGGGGGNSGLTLNVTLKDGQTKPSYNASITVGGSGGTGGTGGDVQVTNTGGIGTQKENSMGIFAQSVGGGGGNAGTVITATTSNDQGGANTAITIGGSGGTGGTGGKVTVKNDIVSGAADSGKIITVGAQSHGIVAMSVGGGGGTGSTAISLLKSSSSSAANTTTTGLIFSLGGNGGGGGTGGIVNVENQGSITTYGQKAFGILAQSIGGGGGDGGVSVTGDLALGKKTDNTTPGEIVSIAIGGFGGSGNSADKVTVTNSGSIETYGKGAAGIYAQSVGGGGGNGGFAATLSKNLFTNPATNLLPSLMTFGMGGNGGSGANGGDVLVENSGSIISHGDKSYGIFAQSVAGGGGDAAFELTAPVWMAADLVANVLLGARNGSTGDVGTVTINTTGTITMYGANSTAQFAQTVSGGGGNVDRFLDLSQHAATIDTSGAIVLPNNGGAVDTVIGAITSVITLGADGVSNLVGKGIDAAHVGDLYTYGEHSAASLLQSIGGGGGNDNEDVIVNTTTTVNLELALGATNSSNNSAGDVHATRTGSVHTVGLLSSGGGVQTIGGGGGTLNVNVTQVAEPSIAAFSLMALPPAVVATAQLGADGGLPGSSSDGGNILATYTGGVSSTGDRSPGLVFQTIGGGGGAMNFTGIDQLDLGIGGINGVAGNGGDVTITNTGGISTAGVLSNGLVVQSIGGGGGTVSTDLDPAYINITTNTGNTGSGGNITFTQNGDVAATGDRSTGVVLQSLGGGGGLVDDFFAGSAGGTGNSGTISFTMNGSINAGGAGGVGIFAQSKARGTQGNIDLSLTSGQTLYFGSGGAGAHFSGGASNTFTNNGSIMGADLLTGWGILGEEGNEAVVNNGLFLGQVNLGTGTNRFTNAMGAVLLPGPQFLLGAASNQLINNGIMRPGGTGLAQHTDMTGSFTQSSTGITFAELDFGTSAIDQVYMTGTAKLAGRIDVALLNPQLVTIGHNQQILFHADGGVTNDGAVLTTLPSVVITYDLQYPATGKDAVLDYNVDFNPPGSNFGRNLLEVGGYFNNIQKAGSSAALAPTIIQLLYAPNLGVYRELLSQLGPDFYGEQQAEQLRASQRFGETMMNGGSSRYALKERTIWFDFIGSNTLHSAYDDYKTVRQQTLGFALGFEEMISAHWSAGLAVSFEDNSANGYQGRWNANGNSERMGAVLRYKNNGNELAALVSYGWNSMDSTRVGQVTTPFNANASRDMQTLTAMVRAAHEFIHEDFYFRPQLDLGVTQLSAGAATENGAGATNLALQGYNEVHAWVRPAVTVRKAIIVTSGTRISLHTEFGYQYFLNGNDTYVRAGFAGAPSGADKMTVPIDLGSMATMSIGLQMSLMDDLSMGVYYTKAISKNYHLDLYNFRFNKSF